MKLKGWKKYLLSVGFLTLPLIASACSVATSDFSTRLISLKNANNQLTSQISLKDYAKFALSSDDGQKAFLKGIAERLMFNWLKKAGTSSNNFSYRNMYNNQLEKVNKDWEDKQKDYSARFNTEANSRLQVEELDKNLGTVEEYKQNQFNTWAASTFTDLLFQTSYLTYRTNGSVMMDKEVGSSENPVASNPVNSTVDQLYKALEEKRFVFATNKTDETLDINHQYAKFMQFVWDNYVQVENPFVVNMSLWKYSVPINGLSRLYTNGTDSTTTQNENNSNDGSNGENQTTTTFNPGTYTMPYFGINNENNNGTLVKFHSFLEQSKNAMSNEAASGPGSGAPGASGQSGMKKIPFKQSFDNKNYGFRFIPNNLTDDSSTFILAKNGTIYNDLFPEFASGSTYLFWKQPTSNTIATSASKNGFNITNIDNSISKKVAYSSFNQSNNFVDSSTGLDLLSSLFISKTPHFNNNNASQIKLDKSYVNRILTPNGQLNALRGSDLYVVDAFRPEDNNLNDFLLLRNQAGVHAISIDGIDFINKDLKSSKSGRSGNGMNDEQAMIKQKKINASQAVLFRALYNQLTTKERGYNFEINVQNELRTFYNNNRDYLVIAYALQEANKQELFNFDELLTETNNSANKEAIKAINNFQHSVRYSNRSYEYNKRLLDTKKTYSDNFGTNAVNNVFAANFIYKLNDLLVTTSGVLPDRNSGYVSSYKQSTSFNPFLSFEIANSVNTTYSPFDNLDKSNLKNVDGSEYIKKTDLDSKLETLTTNLEQQTSSFEGFKDTQKLFTNNVLVNYSINGFSSAGTNLADFVQYMYLKAFVQDIYDFDKYEFKPVVINRRNIASQLDDALNNYLFKSALNALSSDRWLSLSYQNYADLISSDNTRQVNKQKIINDYAKSLWVKNNQLLTAANLKNKLNLVKLLTTIRQFVINNGELFLETTRNDLELGDNAYVVWQNSQNPILEGNSNGGSNTAKSTPSALLDAKSVGLNINNNYSSAYISQFYLTQSSASPIVISTNTPNIYKNSLFNNEASYYSFSNNMLGFKGLQTSSQNNLDPIIKERLFDKPNIDNEKRIGNLFSYISSQNLQTIIEQASDLGTINQIATSLGNSLNLVEFRQVANDTLADLTQKQQSLLTAVSRLKELIGEGPFERRAGYLSTNFITDANNIQHAAYVIGLNNKDFESSASLVNAIRYGMNVSRLTNMKDSNILNYTDFTEYETIANLIVQKANDTNIQQRFIDQYLSFNKINAFDNKLYKDLGPSWIKGWINTI